MILKTFEQVAKDKGYDIRHYTEQIKATESIDKAVKPFDFSNENRTIGALKYYNNFYLYPIT